MRDFVLAILRYVYTVCQKNPPLKFSDIFSPNGWEFLVQILHAYYTFLNAGGQIFIYSMNCNFDEVTPY